MQPTRCPLRVGCAGAGRAGKVHIGLLQARKDIEIVAICTPDPLEQQWSRETVPQATIYNDFDTFLQHGGSDGVDPLECVWLCTPTPMHKYQFTACLQQGIHVFCEKPLSQNPEDAMMMYEESLQHPEVRAACAFPRRFDPGYIAARRAIKEGAIGDILVIRSQTTDRIDLSPFFLKYASTSGGIFPDSSVHDIDAALYLMGGNTLGDNKPTRAYATGSALVLAQLAKTRDADNALGLVDFANGQIANFRCSRTNAHGHHSCTEVIGTKGSITVNKDARVLNVEISDHTGTRINAATDHFELFHGAFAAEVDAFVLWVLQHIEPAFCLKDAAIAVQIAAALQTSLQKGACVVLGEAGSNGIN